MSAIPSYAPLQAAFGLSGNFFQLISTALPWWLTFSKVRRDKSSDEVSVLPYTLSILSSALWIMHARHDPGNTFFLLIINGISILVNFMYAMVHLLYASINKKRRTVYLLVLDAFTICAVEVLDAKVIMGPEFTHFVFTGLIAAAASLFGTIPQLLTIRKVIEEHNSMHLSMWSSLCNLLGSISWFSYGVVIRDFLVSVPNGLVVPIVVCQFILLCVYPKVSTVQDSDIELTMYTAPTSPIATSSDDSTPFYTAASSPRASPSPPSAISSAASTPFYTPTTSLPQSPLH